MFTENSIGMEAWEELTKLIVADNTLLQKELLIKLVCVNETSLALKFARDFGLKEENWPDVLHINAMSLSEDTNSNELKNSTDDSQSYLTLRLLHSDIHIIDTKETFLQAISDISENYDTVGIDAEWRPNLGINSEKLSLLQLAVWDFAYLMDILKLQECLKQCDWEQMMERIFCSKDILKLGYGVDGDLHKLTKLIQMEKAQYKQFHRLVDLGSFCKKASSLYPQAFADFSMSEKSEESDVDDLCAVESKGLSQLCYNMLGRPLNKNEQFSDWEKRPLRLSQKVYAALDAYCLLLIYEKLFHAFQREHLSFDEVLESCLSHVPKKKASKKKKSKQVVHSPKPVSDFRAVADNMAQGVGRYLRLFGADVIFLTNDDDHMQAVKIAQAEDRVILTSGRAYEKLRGYMPEGMCFSVPNEVNAKKQAAIVLKHFNVQCNESDLFSRCSVCNGNEYQSIASDKLYSMRTAAMQNGSSISNDTSYSGAPIQFSALSEQVFERVKTFLICVNCGKVYWEGSHYSRTKEHLSELINLGESSQGNICEILEESKSDKGTPVCSSSEEIITKDEIEATHSSSARTIMHFEEYSSEDDIDDIVFC
ncbi:exonuclease mut-7 homolog isoform X2 [Uloborus diversus]|nr:exonuclease mut-7 homolog isoform X2 [Uloborus diversus]